MKTFTKEDLQTGMIVELNTGDKYMVLRGHFTLPDYEIANLILAGKDDYWTGECFNENLSYNSDHYIAKVYYPPVCGLDSAFRNCDKYTLLWERDEKSKRSKNLPTVYEMCPHCGQDVIITGWDVSIHGFETTCPYCGERMMLCDECLNGSNPCSCDWDSNKNTCQRKEEHNG